MSKPKKVIVEKAEFSMSDGKHVLWIKEESGWSVTVYQHNYDSKRFKTIGHLPTIENARYYADKFPSQ